MRALLRSFRFAWNGIILIFKERNFRIHLGIFTLVVALGFYFKITSHEWLAVLIISAVVFSLEMVNSSIERTCDLYSREEHDGIKKIKDLAAGAVLLSAIFSIIIGILIFWKYFFPN